MREYKNRADTLNQRINRKSRIEQSRGYDAGKPLVYYDHVISKGGIKPLSEDDRLTDRYGKEYSRKDEGKYLRNKHSKG